MSSKFRKVFLNSIFAIAILTNCATTKKNTAEKELVGKITFKQLKKVKHNSEKWFIKECNNYTLDSSVLNEINQNKTSLKGVTVKIFMGTWCSDSRREVPRFYKIVKYLNISPYTLIGLDRNKKSPQRFEKEMNILYVPTFIFYRNTKEIGRIVETPTESLEKDLKRIIFSKK